VTPRDRVLAALRHQETDRVPRFEIWIEPRAIRSESRDDPADAAARFGQDAVMMPTAAPPDSHAWKDGIDEWGRVWKAGTYSDGVVNTREDLARYSPPLGLAEEFFDAARIARVRTTYPDHCLIYGEHIGPFTAAFLAMGFQRFFHRCLADLRFIQEVLEIRTEWCIAMYRKAIAMGADVVVLGDDAGQRTGPMISPDMWRSLVLPCHRRIVEALNRPMIWHSDGNITRLLPMAIEAGFAGVHGLEPAAGVDLPSVRHEYGRHLALVGNVDVGLLCKDDLAAVRRDVDRAIAQGGRCGYMLATCNSIFKGMNPEAVEELFRYEQEVV
jgi:uroporphyrinogen decarboxylase